MDQEMSVDDKELPPSALRRVRELSCTSTSRFKLGAIILKGKRIVGKGINSKKTSPRFGSGQYQCLHAEGRALYDCYKRGHDPRGCVILVHRINDNCSRPCSDCQEMLLKHKIKKVYYFNEDRRLVCTWP